VEVTERALTARSADLLHALEAFRGRGWSIALDAVGADSRSLALMSLLGPEVVKLDLRLIQAPPDEELAEIVTAVNAYAERAVALVLAEGVENEGYLAAAGRWAPPTRRDGTSGARRRCRAPFRQAIGATRRPVAGSRDGSHTLRSRARGAAGSARQSSRCCWP